MTHDKAHEGDCAMPKHLRGVHHDLPPELPVLSYRCGIHSARAYLRDADAHALLRSMAMSRWHNALKR